jgi:NTE family protein
MTIDTDKLSRTESAIPKDIGLCFSGGGMRAIAFQLGCLKTLKKHGLLERIRVISAVSGGAILAAMYAYSQDSFEELEKRVYKLLRKGLTVRLFRRILLCPPRTMAILITVIIAGTSAYLSDLIRIIITFFLRHCRRNSSYNQTPDFIFKIRPPFRRWSSRTSALEDVLRVNLFGNTTLSSCRRNNTATVFNSCDLHTGTVFRFGSKKSGCERFGNIVGNHIQIAHAVAASAAHPVFFPAIDTRYEFQDSEGIIRKQSVLLSDGGILDNLGISCLSPQGRTDEKYNTYTVDYVICCTAGQGEKKSVPYWMIPRIIRTSETINRKLLDFEHENLKRSASSGLIKGFILARFANGGPARDKIKNYPTNFCGLKNRDIDLIVRCGQETTEKYLLQMKMGKELFFAASSTEK